MNLKEKGKIALPLLKLSTSIFTQTLSRFKRKNLSQARKAEMSKNNQHVVPRDGGWAVRGAGNSRVTSTHQTQNEAISAARNIAMNQRTGL